MRQTENLCGKCSAAQQQETDYEAPRRTKAGVSRARTVQPFSLERILQRAFAPPKTQKELEYFGESDEFEEELTADQLAAAVDANRRLARQLGWACVSHDRLQLKEKGPPPLYGLLGLSARPSEEEFAKAVERFQRTEMRLGTADGKLGPGTWNALVGKGALPATKKFAPFSLPVFFGGKQLGVIEKTRPYERCFFDHVVDPACRATRSGVKNEKAGALIELGFRVTDIDAARRAGFVDGYGEPFFRWIQVVQFVTRPVSGGVEFIRRASGEIDPMEVAGVPADEIDRHPYYWDEVTPGKADPRLNVDHWTNRRGENGLCYDQVFMDKAFFPLTTVSPTASWTRPGSHAYFNFELALVGVRPLPQIQNFVLATVHWGYDIFMKDGNPTVDLNGLLPGLTNGSPFFRSVLNREFNRDDVPFPGHCMAGSGYTGRASCRK